MRLALITSAALALVLSSVTGRAEELPKLPSNVVVPAPITLDCVTAAKTLPDLELCRATAESAREVTEEYNIRIERFCTTLVRFDGMLRHKANQGKLDWSDYEELKEQIVTELAECDPDRGDYYAPYRARMREYRQIVSNIPRLREAIVKGIGL